MSADDFSPHHLRELSGIPHTHTGISPRSQRRRSSAAIFLSPDAESSWSSESQWLSLVTNSVDRILIHMVQRLIDMLGTSNQKFIIVLLCDMVNILHNML